MNSTEVDEYEYDDDSNDYDEGYKDGYEDGYKDNRKRRRRERSTEKKKDEKKYKKGGWFSNCIGCIVFIPGLTLGLISASYVLKVVIWVMEGLLGVIEFALKLIFVLIGEFFRYLDTILAMA